MNAVFSWIGYFLLASVILLIEAALYIFVVLPFRLWEKWRYTAQCLHYPPPPGGMFGQMAREYKHRRNLPNKPDEIN